LLVALAERATDLAEGLPALRLGLGVDQVGDALGLGQVQLAVLEGAARELARFGQAQAQIDQGFSSASTTARPPCT
jgi:hypothetical protein